MFNENFGHSLYLVQRFLIKPLKTFGKIDISVTFGKLIMSKEHHEN